MTQPKRLTAIVVLLGFAILLGVFAFSQRESPAESKSADTNTKAETAATKADRKVSSQAKTRSSSAQPSVATNESAETVKTKARERAESAIAGKPATTIDHAARAEETTPWPAGPHLYAEILTGTQRHINVRPNNIGLMPRIPVEPGDPIIMKLNAPNGSPGDVLYVELADGGSFPEGPEQKGKKVTLGENLTAELPFTADLRHGHCTVIVRQAGHSRTIPFWVGPLPELAEGNPTVQ